MPNSKSGLSDTRIAIVDPHEIVREGLHAILSAHGAQAIGKFRDGDALMGAIDSGLMFDVVVLPLEMNGEASFGLIETLQARSPQMRIIVSTEGADEVWKLRKLQDRGVDGIISKCGDGTDVVRAIGAPESSGMYCSPPVRDALRSATDPAQQPTLREHEVLTLMSQGKTSREIAVEMNVSENTVEAYRKALFVKFGAVNAVDLIMKALRRGYIKRRR